MTDISTFLTALGILLNVPPTIVAIDALLEANKKSLSKENLLKLKEDFKLLKGHISDGSKIRNEIEMWKQVHDRMTSFLEVSEKVDRELNHPSGFHIDEAKRNWYDRPMVAAIDDIKMYVEEELEGMEKETVSFPEDPDAFYIAIENDYKNAVIHKNQLLDFWIAFQEAKSKFEKEIKEGRPDSDQIRGNFKHLCDSSRSILKRANSVLICLLNILKITFFNLAKVK